MPPDDPPALTPPPAPVKVDKPSADDMPPRFMPSCALRSRSSLDRKVTRSETGLCEEGRSRARPVRYL